MGQFIRKIRELIRGIDVELKFKNSSNEKVYSKNLLTKYADKIKEYGE